jgi:hypothetical protein
VIQEILEIPVILVEQAELDQQVTAAILVILVIRGEQEPPELRVLLEILVILETLVILGVQDKLVLEV